MVKQQDVYIIWNIPEDIKYWKFKTIASPFQFEAWNGEETSHIFSLRNVLNRLLS